MLSQELATEESKLLLDYQGRLEDLSEAEQKLMASVQEKQTEIAHQAKQLSAIKVENQLIDKKAQEIQSLNEQIKKELESSEAKYQL